MSQTGKIAKIRGPKTSYYQQLAMIEWLEVPANFRLLTGAAQKDVGKVVAGAKLKKDQAYSDLMNHVNQKCGLKWTKDQTKSRIKSMLSTYKKVRNKYYDTTGAKYMLTAEELAAGETIETKLEKECCGFRRLDTLFGGRQNVNPSHLEEPDVDSEDDDSFFVITHDNVDTMNDDMFDGSQREDMTQPTQEILDELMPATDPVSSAAPLSACVVDAGSTSVPSTVTSTSATVGKKRARTIAGTEIPPELIAAAAKEEEERKKREKKDFTTAFAEGRQVEMDVLKDRLQFERDCREDDYVIKRKQAELEEKKFAREEHWRIEEMKAKEKDRKAQFVVQMAKEAKTAAEIKEMWELINDD